MIKVLLVDDDDFVREGLKETIEWDELGFCVVGEARNGKQALAILAKEQIDLVVTDIRMPVMDGLELVDHIKKMEIETEVIILTGYDEFDYAKKAINNGVTLYILKPVNTEELLNSLLKIKIKIKKNNESNKALKNYKENLPVLKQTFLMNLVKEDMSEVDMNKNLMMFEIASLDMTFYVVDILLKESEHIKQINEILEEQLISDFGDKYHLFRLFEKELCVIVFLSNFQNFSTIKNCFKSVLTIVQTEHGKILSIGVGKPHVGYKNMKEAYIEAAEATNYRVVMGWGNVLCLEELRKRPKALMVYSGQDISEVVDEFKNGNYNKGKAILRGKYRRFIEEGIVNIDYIRKFSLQVLFEIDLKVLKPNIGLDEILGVDFLPNKELHELDTIELMRDFMEKITTEIVEYLTNCSKNRYRKEVAEAITIIEKEYKSDLSVENVAENLFISSSHFMHIFKKETGMSFNEYLLKFRFEKAKELLSTRNYKVHDICKMVGFNDPKYFSKIFKRETGVTPKQYIEPM